MMGDNPEHDRICGYSVRGDVKLDGFEPPNNIMTVMTVVSVADCEAALAIARERHPDWSNVRIGLELTANQLEWMAYRPN